MSQTNKFINAKGNVHILNVMKSGSMRQISATCVVPFEFHTYFLQLLQRRYAFNVHTRHLRVYYSQSLRGHCGSVWFCYLSFTNKQQLLLPFCMGVRFINILLLLQLSHLLPPNASIFFLSYINFHIYHPQQPTNPLTWCQNIRHWI